MKKAVKFLGGFTAFCLLAVVAFLTVSFLTAHIEGEKWVGEKARWVNAKEGEGEQNRADLDQNSDFQPVQIFLLSGPLHTDIAIPVTGELLSRFDFLRETRLPLAQDQLKYLSFGWGSEAFYTSTGDYSDIKLSTVFTAVTGDKSVIRIVGLADIVPSEEAMPIVLAKHRLERLLTFIEGSFNRNDAGNRVHIASAQLQADDAFYQAIGHFNIFNPCNQWVNRALRHSGIRAGVWTPTAGSLRRSLRYFESTGVQP